jgi:hypothetical protein
MREGTSGGSRVRCQDAAPGAGRLVTEQRVEREEGRRVGYQIPIMGSTGRVDNACARG